MRTRPHLSASLAAVLAAAALSAGRATADEPAPKGEAKPAGKTPEPPGKTPAPPPKVELRTLPDEEAAPLLARLREAAKTKKAEEALPALAAIAGTTHPAYEAALARLLAHPAEAVAVRAAAAIGERGNEKSGATLWKGWSHGTNAKRVGVRCAVLEAMGRVGAKLDARQYDEVEGLWRQAPSAEALDSVSLYFRLVATDKRPCKMFAQWLDEPRAGNVHDAGNPPASYWQARWTLWSKTKPGVVAALEAITGKHFDSTADAQAWFEANPKFGVRW